METPYRPTDRDEIVNILQLAGLVNHVSEMVSIG